MYGYTYGYSVIHFSVIYTWLFAWLNVWLYVWLAVWLYVWLYVWHMTLYTHIHILLWSVNSHSHKTGQSVQKSLVLEICIFLFNGFCVSVFCRMRCAVELFLFKEMCTGPFSIFGHCRARSHRDFVFTGFARQQTSQF